MVALPFLVVDSLRGLCAFVCVCVFVCVVRARRVTTTSDVLASFDLSDPGNRPSSPLSLVGLLTEQLPPAYPESSIF